MMTLFYLLEEQMKWAQPDISKAWVSGVNKNEYSQKENESITWIMCQTHCQAALVKTGAITSTYLHGAKDDGRIYLHTFCALVTVRHTIKKLQYESPKLEQFSFWSETPYPVHGAALLSGGHDSVTMDLCHKEGKCKVP
jgi:hypothetical protein